ncbi:MAG: YidB family protein [Candidatus Nanopelagicales bacterium]
MCQPSLCQEPNNVPFERGVIMAGLEDLLKGILGGGQQQQQAGGTSGIPDLNKIMMMVGPLIAAFAANGGLQKILGQLTGGGANQANSWVGTGENEPISATEIKDIMPAEVDQIAAETGLDKDEVASGISAILPGLVDKMTPGGKVLDPDGDGVDLNDLLNQLPGGEMLKSLFGK